MLNGGDSTRVGLRAALAAWASDPVLAATLADSTRAFLVLDGAATTIVHASAPAVPFRDAVSDGSGALNPGLAGQIRTVGSTSRPRLVRLRLDPRRIAPPTACLIAGGILDGASALLLVVVGPLPGFRPRPARVETARTPRREPLPAEASAPTTGDRFVWQSDAADRLTMIAGPAFESLAPRLVGQGLTDLATAGHLRDAEAFLAAIGARRTFRALSASLDIGARGTLALDLSGAGLGRSGDPFSGFGGYGVVRAVTEPNAPAEAVAHPAESIASAPVVATFDERRALPDIREAAWPPTMAEAARSNDPATGADGSSPFQDVVAATVPVALAPEPEPAAARSEAAGDRPVAALEGAEAVLSVTEHAAFREIARALGARYAGDDERRNPADDAGGRGESGAVMPFPVLRAVELEKPASVDTAVPSLDDLPVALLIHRGDAVLTANHRLLELTGYADLASLQAVGLVRLFHGLSPDFDEADAAVPGSPRVIVTAQGASRPVAVERGPTNWEGRPATCMILQAVAEADPAREQAAEHLARSFRDGHAAAARETLDALDDGVVTLDPGSRIVAMNRAAADLFACDSREVVGTAFESLFEASQRDAVRASIAGLGSETRIAAAGGRPLMLRASGQDGARVAVLRAAPGETMRTVAGFDRPAFLGRLDREIRTPVEGIVGLADGILAEPHGPVDERYRATLRAIRAAGDHVRGLVSDLIDIATIESGGLALAVRPLPLNELVSGCVELLQPEAARGRIVLRTSFSPDLATLEADEPSLRQAALTVIGDAIRATAAGGQVIVSTTPGERGGVALKVRGTGPGARSAEVEGANEPRAAGDARGTGLGLPLTKALVEANHGCLRISSRGNEGTLVEILLPAPEIRTA